ncbi:DUF6429 family protein [Jeotgalibacillus sp. R-1-5s-1]|uniref:DUF6429 family protein n=1 Tax=Jeotgalibacillus sp. R-1-5s-1 TaxID=2555897 RepID=UPI00106B30A5|nr:DUF6429 family protein [Jeotgalibacillus sp. R-1-5s-1]TFE01338.1 transposase [Jeotgalibacillus sp. R-1-5s-1]
MERNFEEIKELTLLLLYLTAFHDHDFPDFKRSWKGYDFGAMNKLADEKLIRDNLKSKSRSIVFTDEGEKRAQELIQKYLEKNG